MTAAKSPMNLFLGFASATTWLGLLLVAVWCAVWVANFAGLAITPMPLKLFQSAAAMVVIGAILRFVLIPRSTKAD